MGDEYRVKAPGRSRAELCSALRELPDACGEGPGELEFRGAPGDGMPLAVVRIEDGYFYLLSNVGPRYAEALLGRLPFDVAVEDWE